MKPVRFRKEVQISPNGFSDWIQPRAKKYLMACCDCNLVHEMQFRVWTTKSGKQFVQFRARRAIGHTARLRKHK